MPTQRLGGYLREVATADRAGLAVDVRRESGQCVAQPVDVIGEAGDLLINNFDPSLSTIDVLVDVSDARRSGAILIKNILQSLCFGSDAIDRGFVGELRIGRSPRG